MKNRYTSVNPSFTIKKVGFKGLYILNNISNAIGRGFATVNLEIFMNWLPCKFKVLANKESL